MYNFVTEELIKKIPHVEGFTEELLPVTLTKIYAQEEFYKLKYCSTVVYMVPRA